MAPKPTTKEFDTLYKAIVIRMDPTLHEKLYKFGINPCNLTKEDFALLCKEMIPKEHSTNHIYNLVIALAFETCGSKYAEDICVIVTPIKDEDPVTRKIRIIHQLMKATVNYVDTARAVIQLKIPTWRGQLPRDYLTNCVKTLPISMNESIDSQVIFDIMTDKVVSMLVHQGRQCRHLKDSIIMEHFVGTHEVEVCPQCVLADIKRRRRIQKVDKVDADVNTKMTGEMKRLEKKKLKCEKALAIALSTECRFKDTQNCRSRVPIEDVHVQDPHDSKDVEVDQLLRSIRLGKGFTFSFDDPLFLDDVEGGDKVEISTEDEEPIKNETRKGGFGFKIRQFMTTLIGE